MSNPVPSWKTLLSRGIRRRCPQCGEGPLFSRWYKLRDECPACGLKYLENQGDLWGLLLFGDRVLFMIPLIVLFLVAQGTHAGWLYAFGGVLTVGLLFTFPHRIGINVALEYRIRRTSSDLADRAEPKG